MSHINIKKFGLAFGLTGALLYMGCVLLMATVGHDGTVRFFNSLLHGQLKMCLYHISTIKKRKTFFMGIGSDTYSLNLKYPKCPQ